MFLRWFVGAYSVSVLAGFITAPLVFPEASATVIGLFFIPFALPFVLGGSLVGQGAQWALERLLPKGWERTAILSCTVAGIGALGMYGFTGTPLYAIIGGCAAVVGAIMSQHEAAWRWGWLTVVLGAGVASVLVVPLLPQTA